MSIFNKKNTRKGYLINETDAGTYKLCKILNEFDNKEDAKKMLVELLTDKKTEKEILKDYSKKDIFNL